MKIFFERLQCLGSDVEVLDGDEDVGGVFLLGLVSIRPGKGFQKVCRRASSLEQRPGFFFWGSCPGTHRKCQRICHVIYDSVIVVRFIWERNAPQFFLAGMKMVRKRLFVLPVAVVVVVSCFFFSSHPGESSVLWSCSVRIGFRCVQVLESRGSDVSCCGLS